MAQSDSQTAKLSTTEQQGLNQRQVKLIYDCIDSFLPLDAEEQKQFEAEIEKMPAEERDAIKALIKSCR